MIIKEIMNTDPQVVFPDAPVAEIAKKMKEHDCGCCLVAKDDRLVGVVTDRDIALRCVADEKDPTIATAEKVMSPSILYCTETDEAEEVARNMAVNKVRRLPVLNSEKRLVGVVSLGDIAVRAAPEVTGLALGDICRVV